MSLTASASIDVDVSVGLSGGDQPLYHLIVSPFPPGHFVVQSFQGREKISGLYSFDVVVVAPDLGEGVVERLTLGQRAVLILRAGKPSRAFHGILSAVRFEGVRPTQQVVQYRMRLVPKLWLLKQRRRTRIFQNLRVDQVIEAVLKEANVDVRFQLQQRYPAREYCTQYEETDYRFVERLAAEVGIFFYFTQSGALIEEAAAALGSTVGSVVGAALGAAANAALSGIFATGETVVFGDDATAYPPIDDGSLIGASAEALGAPTVLQANAFGGSASIDLASPTLYYLSILGTSTPGFDKVMRFEPTLRVRTNASMYREYDPDRPHVPLVARENSSPHGAGGIAAGLAAGAEVSLSGGGGGLSAHASVDVGGAFAGALGALGALAEPRELEYYEHHAPFLFPKWAYGEGEPARILRQRRRKAHVARGESTCPALAVGYRFRLDDHPASHLNRNYVVTAVEHEGVAKPRTDAEVAMYRNTFSCAPADVVYCPRRPRRRSVMVALTATVTGPLGEEIYTDARGQVKVQFHWDREGRYDERSSCWIRTLQAWGGASWGTQFIPRIGMEVVVTFEGGDPDKPMVLGCLYNGTHPPSFKLPEDKTRSGIRTQSSPDGNGFNELSFEDQKGEEQIYLRAQRNFDEEILGDHSTFVGGGRRSEVKGDLLEEAGGNFETRSRGDRVEDTSGNKIEVTRKSASTIVGANHTMEIACDASLRVHGGQSVIVRGNAQTLIGHGGEEGHALLYVNGAYNVAAAQEMSISALKGITLVCGDSSIELAPDGIKLKAKSIALSGVDRASLTVKGHEIRMGEAIELVSDQIKLFSSKGSLIMDNDVCIDGKLVKLNCNPKTPDPSEPTEDEPDQGVATFQITHRASGEPREGVTLLIATPTGEIIERQTDADGKVQVEGKKGEHFVLVAVKEGDHGLGMYGSKGA